MPARLVVFHCGDLIISQGAGDGWYVPQQIVPMRDVEREFERRLEALDESLFAPMESDALR